MKRFIAAILLLAAILSVGSAAFAQTDDEAEICKIALSHSNVTDAKCIIFERTAVVAVKTEKFVAKSQYQRFVEEFSTQIKQKFQLSHVFVSRSPKVMKQIEALARLDGEQRDAAIQQLIDDLAHFHPIVPIDFARRTFN